MGTVLQELGHDEIILYFIHKVIRPEEKAKSEEERINFFIVRPATIPKKDIHFWNAEHDEYTSSYNLCKNQQTNFIPEWVIKQTLPKEVMEIANKESKYGEKEWYKNLSQKFGDLKKFIDNLESKVINTFKNDFPDILGVSRKGLSLGAEIKYEGFGKKSLPQIEDHYNACSKLKIPYYLVIPKNPFYTKLNKTLLKKVLEEKPEINLYTFAFNIKEGIPSLDSIKFEKYVRK